MYLLCQEPTTSSSSSSSTATIQAMVKAMVQTHSSHDHQEAVKPSADQQQQHSVKQQQQEGVSKKRHQPEHLVSQVGTLSWVPPDLTGLLAGTRPLALLCNGSSARKRHVCHRCKCMPVEYACCRLTLQLICAAPLYLGC